MKVRILEQRGQFHTIEWPFGHGKSVELPEDEFKEYTDLLNEIEDWQRFLGGLYREQEEKALSLKLKG